MQETPLQTFWPAVMLLISIFEVFSVFTFNSPFGGELWSIRTDYESGNLGFDPLGLKPSDPKELFDMKTKACPSEKCSVPLAHLFCMYFALIMLSCAPVRLRRSSTMDDWQ